MAKHSGFKAVKALFRREAAKRQQRAASPGGFQAVRELFERAAGQPRRSISNTVITAQRRKKKKKAKQGGGGAPIKGFQAVRNRILNDEALRR